MLVACDKSFFMQYIIAGLGNPGKEYEDTRHNTGRIVLEDFRKRHAFSPWKRDGKHKALVSEGAVGKRDVILVEPDAFMNLSGSSLAAFVSGKGGAGHLIVVYDDIDLPIGAIRISYDRGAGGHKGLESIIKSLSTKKFIRVRVGISRTTPGGKLKKPKGEENVLKFLMGRFAPREREIMRSVSQKAREALQALVLEGKEKAMVTFN
ncbi:MAG: aminoacyl-tRNA hydrolase [Patescibacteria group bacterium]|nr:MAG: aminoacyl-tRNA hydrolase [Patescibacteria group bacterium]